ncbi:MAG: hypothetical protein AAFY78_06035 [Cyanobacteria bacterium J06648_16]
MRDLSRYSAKMLMAVACTYGQGSYEYQKAGGKRLCDRKWPRRGSGAAFTQDAITVR